MTSERKMEIEVQRLAWHLQRIIESFTPWTIYTRFRRHVRRKTLPMFDYEAWPLATLRIAYPELLIAIGEYHRKHPRRGVGVNGC